MDWILWAFFAMLIVFAITIIITLLSLPKLGDERKNLIKLKAQSYSFMVVIAMLLLEFGESLYMPLVAGKPYEGISPLPFLFTISAVYLITLLVYKKKYGN